jgi:glycerophosphoryl diester phosphodiesterase
MIMTPCIAAEGPLVVAHRGASGYVPEHTLLAVSLAHAMGADYIEQDTVLSQDGVPVVLHDIHLETTTDVALRFPDRSRPDGRWYAIDFTLAELKQLSVTERRDQSGNPVYPSRFPQQDLSLRIPTLAEEIRLIRGLNQSRNRDAGLYIEFKAPRFHTEAGMDIAARVLAVLEEHDLNNPGSKVILQCFDPRTLERLKREQLTPLPMIQLIADNSWGETAGVDFDAMRSPAGLAHIATYAQGIGPWIPHLFEAGDSKSELVEEAHRHGLAVHPYTLRQDDLALPVESFDELQRRVIVDAAVDGIFSDFPDITRQFVDKLKQPTEPEPLPEDTSF